MTLGTLTLYIGIAAVILTLLVGLVFKAQKNWLISLLQNFTGALFVFSGWVKAIDPLGTAYKMEQYFAEFEATFAGTWFSFLAPMFPWLSEYAVTFSVVVIVFEIVLGLMLLIGALPRFTAWAFFLLVAFFTFLTGFTYLTGFVPEGVNFFEFGKWGAFEETNMKVTDCGCFGDFLKLKPQISFFKDLFLLIPALLFLWTNRYFHQLFSPFLRILIVLAAIGGLTYYCFSNYVWDLPHTDFRPFKEGVDVRAQRELEMEAAASVQTIGYKLTNKNTGEVKEFSTEAYLKVYKDYADTEWDKTQLKSKPAIESTKISDFEVQSVDGNDVTEDILSEEGYSLMIVAVKLPAKANRETRVIQDTTFLVDTVQIAGTDSIELVRSVGPIREREISEEVYKFPKYYVDRYQTKLNEILAKAEAANHKVYAVTALTDPNMVEDFRHAVQFPYPVYLADDILLKTIVRSNPGLVLWKDGKIIGKWHYRQLPNYEALPLK